jgi:hypothetical protein
MGPTLLEWAEKRTQVIDQSQEAEVGRLAGRESEIGRVSEEIYDTLLMLASDRMKLSLSRAAGMDRGL